jgi:uncharacterized BrkB/YihY/UPF0761 family membrane protein
MHTYRLPILVALPLLAAAALWLYGPIAQPAHYHHFADIRMFASIPYAADVLSNLPFFIIGLWGLCNVRHASAPLKNATTWLCVDQRPDRRPP